MWARLLNWFTGGVIDKAIAGAVAWKTSQTEVDKETIAASIEHAKLAVEQQRLDAEHWLTRLVRPLFAIPVGVYYAKLFLWDKVAGRVLVEVYGWDRAWFVTDPLSPEMFTVSQTDIAAFFGTVAALEIAKRFSRR